MTTDLSAITYPARPVKGGPLDLAMQSSVYFALPEWYFEPKYNGWRGLVHVPTGTMWNRHGQRLSINGEFSTALAKLKALPFEWLDVEAMERRHGIGKGSLIILDWVTGDDLPYAHRRRFLELTCVDEGLEILTLSGPSLDTDRVYLTAAYSGDMVSPLRMYWHLKKANEDLGCTFYEGVVAKRASSLYPIQLRSPHEECSDWVKHRFTTK